MYQNIQNPQDARQTIRLYQLWKSQLVFTIAELQDNNSVSVPILQTSVVSQIMIDITARGQRKFFILIIHKSYFSLFLAPVISVSNGTTANRIKCVPQKGDWQGGNEVVMIMPNLVRQKGF